MTNEQTVLEGGGNYSITSPFEVGNKVIKSKIELPRSLREIFEEHGWQVIVNSRNIAGLNGK